MAVCIVSIILKVLTYRMRLDQVQALLGFNGYQYVVQVRFFGLGELFCHTNALKRAGNVFYRLGTGKRTTPKLYCKCLPRWQKIGECDSVSGGEFSSHPDAQDWLYTTAIAIEDPYQGQGIGRYLLQYSLQEMHKVGYRHATISTDWENYRAFLFYSNCGYRAVDWTYELEKHFD